MIKITGLNSLYSKLDDIIKIERNTKPLMNTIGHIVKNSIENSFENETSPFGDRWKPISAVTAFAKFGKGNISKGKARAYTKNGKRQTKAFLNKFGAKGSNKILRDTGALADRWIVKASKNRVIVSNNTQYHFFKYGLTHQYGSNNAFGKGIKVPARPFLPVKNNGVMASDVKDDIINATIDFIEERAKLKRLKGRFKRR